jgi:hypothetical protein
LTQDPFANTRLSLFCEPSVTTGTPLRAPALVSSPKTLEEVVVEILKDIFIIYIIILCFTKWFLVDFIEELVLHKHVQ